MVQKKNSKKKTQLKKNSKKNVSDQKIESEVLVSEEEISEQIKEEKKIEKVKSEEEDITPNWYHYVIVLLVFFGGFYLIYLGFEYFSDDEPSVIIHTKTYKYPYIVGGITYNIYFHSPVDEIEKYNVPIEVDNYDIIGVSDLKFSFKVYNGTDNGEVTRASTKLFSFFKQVYGIEFDPEEDFVKYLNYTCDNSTFENRVLVFDPYTERTGVFENQENGCILLDATVPTDMIRVTDRWIFELIGLDDEK